MSPWRETFVGEGCTVRALAYRAFTLAELVAVTVIIAIIAGIAVPRFSEAVARHHLDAAARRITVDVALTRRLAKIASYQHRMRFWDGTDQYVIEYTADGSTWQGIADSNHPEQGYTVDLSAAPYRASITAVSCGVDRAIVFDGFGTPSQVGFILLGVGERYKLLTVSSETGEVSTVDWQFIPLPTGTADGGPIITN